MYGLDAIKQVIEQGILWKLFVWRNWIIYEAVTEHYENLTKNHEFLKVCDTTRSFLKNQAILGYLYYNRWEICCRWPKSHGQKQSSIAFPFKTKQKVSMKLF
jgi:hypothetical protein